MLILAVEPDPTQAAHVRALAGPLRAELVIEESAERALQALGRRIPAVVLASPLLSWRDEMVLSDRLRELGDAAAHVQTLMIPLLAVPSPKAPSRGMLAGIRRTRDNGAAPDGCDPEVFAQQIREYLQRAAELVAPERVLEPIVEQRVVIELIVQGLVEEPIDDGFRLTPPAEWASSGHPAVALAETEGFAPQGEALDDHPLLDFNGLADVAIEAMPILEAVPAVELLPVFEPEAVLAAEEPAQQWVPLTIEDLVEVPPHIDNPEPPPPDEVWVLEPEPDITPAPSGKQPAQDEWGFFDPDQCGFAALRAKLEAISEKAEPDPDTTVRVVAY